VLSYRAGDVSEVLQRCLQLLTGHDE